MTKTKHMTQKVDPHAVCVQRATKREGEKERDVGAQGLSSSVQYYIDSIIYAYTLGCCDFSYFCFNSSVSSCPRGRQEGASDLQGRVEHAFIVFPLTFPARQGKRV